MSLRRLADFLKEFPLFYFSPADIDECEDRELCQPHMCRNVMGSYQCLCSHGYQKLNETSNTCHGKECNNARGTTLELKCT